MAGLSVTGFELFHSSRKIPFLGVDPSVKGFIKSLVVFALHLPAAVESGEQDPIQKSLHLKDFIS